MGIPVQSRRPRCDVGDLLPTPRRPSLIGADLSGVHPKSTQIGVHFRETGLNWRRVQDRIAAVCLRLSAGTPAPTPYVHPFPPKVTQGTQESAEGRTASLVASSFSCQRSPSRTHFPPRGQCWNIPFVRLTVKQKQWSYLFSFSLRRLFLLRLLRRFHL